MTVRKPSYRVLVVEDEYFIAADLVRMLQAEGFLVAGPVSALQAMSALLDDGRVDFAVVDINLDGSISFDVSAELQRRGVPFLFLTGYDASVVPLRFRDTLLVPKPHEGSAILAAIAVHRQAPPPTL